MSTLAAAPFSPSVYATLPDATEAVSAVAVRAPIGSLSKARLVAESLCPWMATHVRVVERSLELCTYYKPCTD